MSKKRYYNQYFLDNITDGKKIWKGIKQIVHFKPNTNQKLVKIMDNNEEISDTKSIADAFNNYFRILEKSWIIKFLEDIVVLWIICIAQ